MQDSRLFRIVYYLLDKGKCTASELADKFEVSTRTIYRDLDVISAAGIPIYATQGKGGGISILPEYVMDNALLSDEEKEKIVMALKVSPLPMKRLMTCSQNWERCFKQKQQIGLKWTFRIG